MVCALEIIDAIVILGTFSAALIAALYYKRSVNPVKKAQKRNEMSIFDNLTQYREVEKGTITDILKQKDNQIKSLNARLKVLEPLVEEIEDPTQKSITFEDVTAIVQQVAPQFAPMLPLMKKQIMSMTKGMTQAELLGYVKQFTGNKQSQGQTDPQSLEYNKDWA